MARSFNVSYRFTAKNSFSAVSKKIKTGNRRLRASFKKLGKRLRKTRGEFKKTSNGMSSGFKKMAGAAIAFFSLRGFFTVGARFQDAMADLSAITGAVGKDLDKLRDKTLSMAKASVTSQAEVAEAIKLVASAKPDLLKNIDALTATTDAVLLLKNAAGIELASAANITAQGLNIFGARADQASRFVNVLAAGAKLGSSEIRETGEAMLLAGPAARAAGLSFEQLNAAIQITALGGIKGARAGTALNAILGRLQRAGIDFQNLGLQGAFEKIKVKMDSLANSTARAQFAAKIFGEEHSKVGFAILANVKHLDAMTKSITATNIAQEQADINLATFSAKFRGLGIVIKDKVIRAFLRLEPAITKQVVAFTKFLDTITPEQVDAFASSIASLVGIMGSLLSSLKPVFSLLGGIAKFFGGSEKKIELEKKIITSLTGEQGAGLGPLVGAGGDISRTDINMNINAPEGIVQSIIAKTVGGRNTNVGFNMAGG